MSLTVEDVIEEHRIARGAKSVNLTLKAGGTPEEIRDELARLTAVVSNYEAFPAAAREAAKEARFLKNFSTIFSLAGTTEDQRSDPKVLIEKLREIRSICDWVSVTPIAEDVEWMINKGYAPEV